MKERLVFSTDKRQPSAKSTEQPARQSPLVQGPTKMRLEHKGGKKVTILFNLPFDDDQAKEHMRSLQRLCACGGSFKHGIIELHGDIRGAVERYFADKGLKVKRAGG